MQTPSTNLQAPEKLQTSSPKAAIRAAPLELELGVSLVLGACCLALSISPFSFCHFSLLWRRDAVGTNDWAGQAGQGRLAGVGKTDHRREECLPARHGRRARTERGPNQIRQWQGHGRRREERPVLRDARSPQARRQ